MNGRKTGLNKRFVSQTALHAVIIVLLFIMLYPLAMALWDSFKTDYGYDMTKWYPTMPLKISNISKGFNITKTYIFNTLIVAAAGIFGMLFVSSLGAFAFSKTRFPGRMVFFYMVLVLMMTPAVMTLIPAYILYKDLGLYNSRMALIIPLWTSACVGAVFLLTIFFNGIPNDIFESAKIDGAGLFRCYLQMALPLSIPIIGTIAIMQIIGVWNDYLWPKIVLEPEKYTISAGLIQSFTYEYTADMPAMFGSYLVASIPLIALFVFANKFYVQGLIGASIKM